MSATATAHIPTPARRPIVPPPDHIRLRLAAVNAEALLLRRLLRISEDAERTGLLREEALAHVS